MDDHPWDDVPSKADSGSKEDDDAPSTATHDPPATSTPASSSTPNTTTNTTTTPSTTNRPPGGRKAPAKKVLAQSTVLQSVDHAADPLGPLGAAEPAPSPGPPPAPAQADQAPIPPRKETKEPGPRPVSGAPPPPSPAPGPDDTDSLLDPPHIQPPRQGPLSMSLEQAAKPTFDIDVGDPHKVGDLTSSHIVYQVRTKTTSKAYKQPEFAVSRRYRDFLWLYTSMHTNNPGVVIPPPPEKQAVGRFDSEFVESRRQALERMLNKIAAHPILHHDADLKIFLESEAFNLDVKNKENRDPLLDQSNKGMLSAIGINVGSSAVKFVEHDDWFHDRRIYLDALENQLKALMKALDTVVIQRKGLADAAADFATSLGQLAHVELSPTFSAPLHALSDVQVRIKELYQRQAQQDVLTLGITIDEYVRLIGSVKTAFGQRQKAYHSWHAAESELQKKRNTHDKLLRQGRSQQDKLNEVSASVSDAEKKAHQARLLFEDMGRLMKNELERFEREKVEDFKSGVETFLEGAVEAQKELIELWETFLLQMDADEDELLGRPSAPPDQSTTATTDTSQDQTDSHPTEGSEQDPTPEAPVATAADLALEQDA